MKKRPLNVRHKLARRLAPIVIVAGFGIATAACGSSGGSTSGGQPNNSTPTTSGHSGGSGGSGGAGF